MVNKPGRQKKCVKISSTLPTFIKRNQDKKLLDLSQIFLKISTHQMFGYPDLDAGLNTSQFGGDIAFSCIIAIKFLKLFGYHFVLASVAIS